MTQREDTLFVNHSESFTYASHVYDNTFVLANARCAPSNNITHSLLRYHSDYTHQRKNMKLTSIFIAATRLLATASAIASTEISNGTQVHTLGDDTANLHLDNATPAHNAITDRKNNKLDRRILGHIPGDRLSEMCRGCKNWIDECVDDCKGGDQGSCYDYCRCEGLLGPGCSLTGKLRRCTYV